MFTRGVTAATRTIVEAGGEDRVVFANPAPGMYPFACTIHDGMHGSLEIEAPATRQRSDVAAKGGNSLEWREPSG